MRKGVICLVLTLSLGLSTVSQAVKVKDESKVQKVKVASGIVVPVSSDFLNIRKLPNAESKIVGRMFRNTGAEVLEEDGNWLLVQSGDIKGYISKKYVVQGKELKSLVNDTLDSRDLIVKYNEVTGGYKKLKDMRHDDFSYSISVKVNGNIYRTPEATKYRKDITQVGNFAEVIEDKVVVRSERNSADISNIICEVNKGDKLSVNFFQDNWVNVSANGNVDGWIEKDCCLLYTDNVKIDNIVTKVKNKKFNLLGFDGNMYQTSKGYVRKKDAKLSIKSTCKAEKIFDVDEELEVTEYTPTYIKVKVDNEEYYTNAFNFAAEARFDEAVPFELTHDTHGDTEGNSHYYEYDYEDGTDGATPERDEIVKKALKYLGNPYVWGGTSLTHGCDCSAFCQGVLRKFDINMGRTTRDQCGEKRGRDIKDKYVRPGDLIYYTKNGTTPYHVVMYLGDDKCINASCRAYGICISDVKWDRLLKCKNYID